MHNNFYFLKHLSKALEKKIIGAVISQCFSQSKNELILQFETTDDPFFIKASLVPSFTCLSFPREFHRARKNSIDLFTPLIGQRVMGIRQFNNERSFLLILSNNLCLLFKMHGNRSNIVLFENENISQLFKNNLPADNEITLNTLDRDIDWSYEAFLKHSQNLPSLYFTFGKLIWQHLEALGYNTLSTERQWEIIRAIKEELDQENFYITQWRGTPVLSLIKTGTIQKEFSTPIHAINEFYYTFTQVFALHQEKNKIINALQARLQASTNYIKKTSEKLNELTKEDNYKNWADLIMANLHAIAPGSEKVKLQDFYNDNNLVEIKLKKELSAQKNAELFYKKSKNQNIELKFLQEALDRKEKDIHLVKEEIETVKQLSDLKALRQYAVSSQREKSDVADEKALPYHEFIFNGYKIWVGKNTQANDTLTLRLSFKEDLWLHAKDVTGSHVIIKYQSGKNFPKDVIERAAQLAAYNSKRKNETLCPVIVTPKKYVRKRKGDPAGAVVVEREDVILVEPKL